MLTHLLSSADHNNEANGLSIKPLVRTSTLEKNIGSGTYSGSCMTGKHFSCNVVAYKQWALPLFSQESYFMACSCKCHVVGVSYDTWIGGSSRLNPKF